MDHPILQVQAADMSDLVAAKGRGADAQEPDRALMRSQSGECTQDPVEVLVTDTRVNEKDVRLLAEVSR